MVSEPYVARKDCDLGRFIQGEKPCPQACSELFEVRASLQNGSARDPDPFLSRAQKTLLTLENVSRRNRLRLGSSGARRYQCSRAQTRQSCIAWSGRQKASAEVVPVS